MAGGGFSTLLPIDLGNQYQGTFIVFVLYKTYFGKCKIRIFRACGIDFQLVADSGLVQEGQPPFIRGYRDICIYFPHKV